MWQVNGKKVDNKRFARFEPIRVLNYYDGPRIFTFKDIDDALCLAYWNDEDDTSSRFLVVAVDEQLISDLERGLISVREILTQPRLWTVDWQEQSGVVAVWLIALHDVPEDSLPKSRTMLHRSLDPILSLRAIGETIRAGEIPGSVVRSTVEGAQKALKCLAEYEIDLQSTKGRPSRALQKLYDLPVQKTLAASFEVQFRSPLSEPSLFDGLDEEEIREETKVLGLVSEHLKIGLEWLTTNPTEASALPVPDNPELSRCIIKALKHLTPSPRGPVRELEIRGKMASDSFEPFRLIRTSRSIVNGALARIPNNQEQRVELKGRIRELNERLMRFELHNIDNPPKPFRVCEFDNNLWDDVYEMLGVEETVDVLGVETSSTSIVRVLDLIRPATRTSS